MEKKISMEERNAAKFRLDLQEHENIRSQLQNELDTLKYTVERTASDLESMKSNVTSLKKDIIAKTEKLGNSISLREQLQAKLEEVGKGALSAEDRAAIADAAFAQEEEDVVTLEATLRKTREIHFKKKQQVFNSMTSEKDLVAEIQGGRA